MENWKRVHICTFAFFQFPTLPIFHIYNLYFSNFPLVHFCIPILTPIYPNIPIQSSIYHKHSPQDSIRVLHTFEGGVSKHPVLPTGHYLMYKTYSALIPYTGYREYIARFLGSNPCSSTPPFPAKHPTN